MSANEHKAKINSKTLDVYCTEKETTEFKELFSKYCRGEVNAGHCADGDCEFCAVNRAYERIFAVTGLDEDE